MSLIRWEPFGSVDIVQSHAAERFCELAEAGARGHRGKVEWAPSADISETEKEYVIRAELPAVKKEDVQVTLDSGMTDQGRANRASKCRVGGQHSVAHGSHHDG
jgi:HSP20 family protein